MRSIKSVFIKATCMFALVSFLSSFSLINAQSVFCSASDTDCRGDIRFVNAMDGMLVFELYLKNLPVKGSIFQIKDETGNLIFEQNIKTETYKERYRIERNEIIKITFEVTGKKMLLNKSFSIISRMEERIEVARL